MAANIAFRNYLVNDLNVPQAIADIVDDHALGVAAAFGNKTEAGLKEIIRGIRMTHNPATNRNHEINGHTQEVFTQLRSYARYIKIVDHTDAANSRTRGNLLCIDTYFQQNYDKVNGTFETPKHPEKFSST